MEEKKQRTARVFYIACMWICAAVWVAKIVRHLPHVESWDVMVAVLWVIVALIHTACAVIGRRESRAPELKPTDEIES